jgi:hypothetical protein
LKLRRQPIGAPGATQMGDQGQDAAKKNEAEEPPQAKFQHGLATTSNEL